MENIKKKMTEMIKKQKQNYFDLNKIKNPTEGRGEKGVNSWKSAVKEFTGLIFGFSRETSANSRTIFKLETKWWRIKGRYMSEKQREMKYLNVREGKRRAR